MKEVFIYSKHCNYIKVQWLHLTPTKMGVVPTSPSTPPSSPKWKRNRYKKDDEAVPTSPNSPPSSPK